MYGLAIIFKHGQMLTQAAPWGIVYRKREQARIQARKLRAEQKTWKVKVIRYSVF